MVERVRWNESEQEAVAFALARNMLARPGTHPKRLIGAAIAETLPPHRRRTPQQVAAYAPVWRRLKARAAHLLKHHPGDLLPATKELLDGIPTPVLLAELERRGELPDAQSAPPPKQAERMLRVAASRQPAPPVAVAPRPKPPKKVRPVRVGIIGALPRQFRRLEDTTTGLPVELVALDRERPLNGSLGGLDHVVAMRFIEHARWNELHSGLEREQIHWLDRGGVTALREQVAAIAAGGA